MRKKLICGVGINDADYSIYKRHASYDGGYWTCPYYIRWKGMIHRCYGNRKFNPTYEDCVVCDEWLRFSNFKAWMIEQDWEGKYLDKDILCVGNKVYSPEMCTFVSNQVNIFVQERQKDNGLPLGVYWNKSAKKYKAGCRDNYGQQIYLGYFDDPYEGHKRWLAEKLKYAKMLAHEIEDQRVAKALIDRYENYQSLHNNASELRMEEEEVFDECPWL